MNYGFVKTAVVTPKIKVAHVAHNGAEIEKLMKEISYESLTENIIAYCDGDFIKEYARLTKPQNNIHIYRGKIITMLEQMQNDDEMYELITIICSEYH
mgnify:CR=1 FL=1